MKTRRKVMVMHKCTEDEERNTLAVGKTFTFPGSQDAYTVQANGSVVNAKPQPWKNKAERKRFLRERRQQQPATCSP
jgi:hypothetical protein